MRLRRGGRRLRGRTPGLGQMTITHALCLALAGRMEEARQVCARGLEVEPTHRIRFFSDFGLAPAIAAKLDHAARVLGIPE